MRPFLHHLRLIVFVTVFFGLACVPEGIPLGTVDGLELTNGGGKGITGDAGAGGNAGGGSANGTGGETGNNSGGGTGDNIGGGAGGGTGDNMGGGTGGGNSNSSPLICKAGAFEVGRPTSPYAFEIVRTYETIGFRPGFADAGVPLSTVTLAINGYVPQLVAPIFKIQGPAGGTEFDAVGIPGADIQPLSQAAVIESTDIIVNADGSKEEGPISGMPPMTWYLRCHGKAQISPETDAEFCESYGFECSELTATDNTGNLRTVSSCGICAAQEVCRPEKYYSKEGEASWEAKRCRVCVGESDAQLCQRVGANCDVVTALDDCDVPRTVNCGSCTSPSICGGGGTPNVCGGGSIVCTTGRVQWPGDGGVHSCEINGTGGVTILGTQSITDMSFVWNRNRYQFNTTVPSIVWGNDPLAFYLYSASDTQADWSEGPGGLTSSRSGNVITVDGYAQRSSPMGCSNSYLYAECKGYAPFVFAP